MMMNLLVPIITFSYTARIFLTEGNGQLGFAASTVEILSLFASLGIYTYGVREGTKRRDNFEDFTEFAWELISINIISTALTYAVFLLSVFSIPAFISHRNLLLIYGIQIAFDALGLDWVFGVFEDYEYITKRQIFCR